MADELERRGWTRHFIACEPRLSEAVAMYREAGFEVHLEPLPAVGEEAGAEGDSCRACYKGFEDQYRIIYTRPAARKQGLEDDLFEFQPV